MTPTPLESDCREALAWLQSHLDGARAAMSAAVTAHVAGCRECRDRMRAADRLVAGLSVRPASTRFLTERIVTALRRDARRRQIGRWAAAGSALAAAIVLAIWLSGRTRTLEKPGFEMAGSKAPSLRTELADAGEAVVELTKRTANETVGESRLLVPKIEVPKLVTASWALATTPLDSTGKGIVDGLEPVATSARRAVNLFWRDTPEKDGKN